MGCQVNRGRRLLGAPTKSKLEPREYDPAKFPPSKAEYPMNEIRACVDVLLADGRMAAPKSKRSK
jgi:hypothetical protein